MLLHSLITLSIKQWRIKYHFLRLWYDSTWDWVLISRAIGEHFILTLFLMKFYSYIYCYMALSILTETGSFVECSPMVRETWVQSQVESYQRLKNWYLIPPCLTLSNIRYVSRVKWSNPEKGVALSLTPWWSSYWKGSLRTRLLLITTNNSFRIWMILKQFF